MTDEKRDELREREERRNRREAAEDYTILVIFLIFMGIFGALIFDNYDRVRAKSIKTNEQWNELMSNNDIIVVNDDSFIIKDGIRYELYDVIYDSDVITSNYDIFIYSDDNTINELNLKNDSVHIIHTDGDKPYITIQTTYSKDKSGDIIKGEYYTLYLPDPDIYQMKVIGHNGFKCEDSSTD